MVCREWTFQVPVIVQRINPALQQQVDLEVCKALTIKQKNPFVLATHFVHICVSEHVRASGSSSRLFRWYYRSVSSATHFIYTEETNIRRSV